MHTEYPTPEQRAARNFCKVYARRTPMIPFHNGQMTYSIRRTDGTLQRVQEPCLGCGKVAD